MKSPYPRIFSISVLSLALLSPSSAYAERQLSPRQLERVTAVKNQMEGVEKRSAAELGEQLLKMPSPESHLKILEAITSTYSEMAEKYEVKTKEKKEWLYSMIQLNMAYFRLGGADAETQSDSALNIAIRRKLKEHLPEDFMSDRKIFYSLE